MRAKIAIERFSIRRFRSEFAHRSRERPLLNSGSQILELPSRLAIHQRTSLRNGRHVDRDCGLVDQSEPSFA